MCAYLQMVMSFHWCFRTTNANNSWHSFVVPLNFDRQESFLWMSSKLCLRKLGRVLEGEAVWASLFPFVDLLNTSTFYFSVFGRKLLPA